MLHYLCKICDQAWLGDCWCPECGRICKPDPEHHGREREYKPRNPPPKWTKKIAKELYKKRQARKFYNKYR